jgi:DNA-directed RNA polymerase subunit RPC12/RpoP
MTSLLLCLKYRCTGCGDPIRTTLQCDGQSAKDEEGAMIKIPCPRCGTRSQVVFTGDGEIHAVTRARTYERIPEPSIN